LNYETFQSPFTWRYGTPELRAIWSEAHKRRLWRKVWLALAEAAQALPDNRAFAAMVAVHDVLKPTPLFRAGVWLVACVLLAAAALRRRATPAGAFVVAVAGSAAVYVASFTLLGVAADLRYAWWSIVAVLLCLPAWVATVRR